MREYDSSLDARVVEQCEHIVDYCLYNVTMGGGGTAISRFLGCKHPEPGLTGRRPLDGKVADTEHGSMHQQNRPSTRQAKSANTDPTMSIYKRKNLEVFARTGQRPSAQPMPRQSGGGNEGKRLCLSGYLKLGEHCLNLLPYCSEGTAITLGDLLRTLPRHHIRQNGGFALGQAKETPELIQ
ncbi:hypothetical protein DEVEQU_00746 [Devosia equisanguinis]|uniref:Uncharacterized protein n=1 Tax=Devosia equisanguinis TaxID=2490941 RepID=A0A3S5D382_9HYPH|nr:hypothetical protein DEVEQU_00746 [Devosia equisanguinis]